MHKTYAQWLEERRPKPVEQYQFERLYEVRKFDETQTIDEWRARRQAEQSNRMYEARASRGYDPSFVDYRNTVAKPFTGPDMAVTLANCG